MKDLVNLQSAFMALDKDETGRILYDVKKIAESKFSIINLVNKYDLEIKDGNQQRVLIDFSQFMDIMTNNIIYNRQRFGTEATCYESDQSNVHCLICPSK